MIGRHRFFTLPHHKGLVAVPAQPRQSRAVARRVDVRRPQWWLSDVTRRERLRGNLARRRQIEELTDFFHQNYSTASTTVALVHNELVIRSTKNGAMLSIPSVSTRFSVSGRFFL
jgi:hypothetical protein